jgi:hypothetical protein
VKSGSAELRRYRAEEINLRTNAPWKKGKHMQHTPAPELDAETIEAAAARVAAMNLSADKPSFAAEINAIREETKDLPPLDASQAMVIRNGRKTRSDKGVQRGPKAPSEPEAAATTTTTALTVELTVVQYADLEREAARVFRDIELRYFREATATVLLNSRVQKYWHTLMGE